tara:strand:+ start:108 stop:590 length:483 start_codon:yes stop_codon:yes gene_type:complete
MNIKIGNGYDTHPLIKGETLILGGINIPHYKGIKGHSDGDALIHSIIDSILGALGIGDIGKFFPSKDQKYKNISSLSLLSEIAVILDELAYDIVNFDSTIILESPQLKDYISPMRKSISQCLGISNNKVSIKATTNDRLGFIGKEEGISVITTTLIKEKS